MKTQMIIGTIVLAMSINCNAQDALDSLAARERVRIYEEKKADYEAKKSEQLKIESSVIAKLTDSIKVSSAKRDSLLSVSINKKFVACGNNLSQSGKFQYVAGFAGVGGSVTAILINPVVGGVLLAVSFGSWIASANSVSNAGTCFSESAK